MEDLQVMLAKPDHSDEWCDSWNLSLTVTLYRRRLGGRGNRWWVLLDVAEGWASVMVDLVDGEGEKLLQAYSEAREMQRDPDMVKRVARMDAEYFGGVER